jgi:hypothetical protein
VTVWNTKVTALQNTTAEQKTARGQQVTADEHGPRPPWNASRRWSEVEAAGINSGGWPGRVETRLTNDGGRVAALVQKDQGRVRGADKEQQWGQCGNGKAQQEDAARRSEVRVSEPADMEGHHLRETKAARVELLHTAQEPEK